MNSNEISIWIRSLERLSQRFADAADEYEQRRGNKSLDMLLLHYSHAQPQNHVDACFHYLSLDAGEDFVQKRANDDERNSILHCQHKARLFGKSARRHLFMTIWGPSKARGNETSKRNAPHVDILWSRWERLVRDAGSALFVAPPSVQERFRVEIENARFDGISSPCEDWEEAAWIWSLFNIAWSKTGGPLLRAEQQLFVPDYFDIKYDPEAVRAFAKRRDLPAATKRILRQWSDKLPDFYYSKLCDVYNASMYFIDWMIGVASDSLIQVDPSAARSNEEIESTGNIDAQSGVAKQADISPLEPAPKGKPGRKPDEAKMKHATRANELRMQKPQKTWKQCSEAVNSEFNLIGENRYNEHSMRDLHRLKIGDKANSQKKRD